MNDTAANIGVHGFCKIGACSCLDMYLGVELLGHVAVPFSFFEKFPYCFPQWLHQFTFSTEVTAVCEGALFSTCLLTFVIYFLFGESHSGKGEVISHCDFNLQFPYD